MRFGEGKKNEMRSWLASGDRGRYGEDICRLEFEKANQERCSPGGHVLWGEIEEMVVVEAK